MTQEAERNVFVKHNITILILDIHFRYHTHISVKQKALLSLLPLHVKTPHHCTPRITDCDIIHSISNSLTSFVLLHSLIQALNTTIPFLSFQLICDAQCTVLYELKKKRKKKEMHMN